jgi:hypothetical protein
MAEDYGLVRYKNIPASTAQDVLDAIYDCIIDTTSPDHYWQLLTGSTYTKGSSTELYLMPVQQGHGGDSDDQRIGVRIDSGMLQIAYDPSGVLTPSMVPTNAGLWTGWRSITASTAAIGTAITHVYVVEYRDSGTLPAADLPGRNYGSSLAILLANEGITNKHYQWAAMVGRIIKLDNEEDEDLSYLGANIGLRGDGLFVGAPNEGYPSVPSTVGLWLGFDDTNPDNCSVIRTWDDVWHWAQPTEDVRNRNVRDYINSGPTFNHITVNTADIGGSGQPNAFRLFVPFNIFGRSKRLPTKSINLEVCGIIGQTKYIRVVRQAMSFAQSLNSDDVDSQQSWKPLIYNATITSQRHVILWNKTPIEVL